MSTDTPASVSTHILDTSVGRPAEGVAIALSVRAGADSAWRPHAASSTDADGRCKDLPALPEGITHARLGFDTEAYFSTRRSGAGRPAEEQQDAPGTGSGTAPGSGGAFFPEVAITFAVRPGEHYHVPLLLNPFGYSVYRGS